MKGLSQGRESRRRTGPCSGCQDWRFCKGDSRHTWDFDGGRPKFCFRQYRLPGQKAADPVLPPELKKPYPALKGIRFSYGSSSSRTVCFLPGASDQLYCYFHWGKKHPVNLCEQMTAAAGYISEEQVYVEERIPIPLRNRSGNTAAFSTRLHRYALDEIEVMNRNLPLCPETYPERDGPLRFLGYIHSHPGELNAVMSRPDLELHEWLMEQEGSHCFTGIINPQRRDLCIYWDSVYSPVHVLLLAEGSAADKWMESDTGHPFVHEGRGGAPKGERP